MASDSTKPSSMRSLIELELLQTILHNDDSDAHNRCYPWNPADPQTEEYLADLEQELSSLPWLSDVVDAHAQALESSLNSVWATMPSAIAAEPAEPAQTSLMQQLMAHMPHHVLERITQKAQELLSANLSLADQLVACVQDVLPNWGEEDLHVLARPYAYAMRDSETEMLEGALRTVRYAAWTELSGVEQARLSLAIARYALTQSSTGSPDER